MKSINHGPTAGLVLTLGLVAGTWLTFSAAVPGGAVAAETVPDRIELAQVTLSPMVIAPPQAEPEAQAEAVDRPVSYANDQADRGEESYQDVCAECHGDDLTGGLIGGPPLRGVSFEQRFAEGAPASGLFLYMSNLMPPDAPGRYSESTYIDIMAYILKENGFQAGAALPTDVDALGHLLIEK